MLGQMAKWSASSQLVTAQLVSGQGHLVRVIWSGSFGQGHLVRQGQAIGQIARLSFVRFLPDTARFLFPPPNRVALPSFI
jgi:hypothetical protein